MRTSRLSDQIWRGDHNPEEGAALDGLVVPDALLLSHLHLEAELALPPSLAIPVSQHPLHTMPQDVNVSAANVLYPGLKTHLRQLRFQQDNVTAVRIGTI